VADHSGIHHIEYILRHHAADYWQRER
jgi:hypothetical protein